MQSNTENVSTKLPANHNAESVEYISCG